MWGGLLALMAGTSASAQTTALRTGGLMVDKDIVMPGDLFELSQTQFNFGTAGPRAYLPRRRSTRRDWACSAAAS